MKPRHSLFGTHDDRNREGRKHEARHSEPSFRDTLNRARKAALATATLITALALAACGQPELADQPKYETYEAAPGWPDQQAARLPPAGTVARDDPLGRRPERIPMPLDRALLERGRRGFTTFCEPCHGGTGNADGMVVQRGFPAPPSFHIQRLRESPLGHFYDVISDGYGVMYAYGDRVPPAERWAIAAYIRALQTSQHMPVDSLGEAQRARLPGEEP